MLIVTDAKAVVVGQIQALLAESEAAPPPVTGVETLGDLGVTSLMLARLIVGLETELDVDPFGSEDAVLSDVRTVDDLATVYQNAVDAADAAL